MGGPAMRSVGGMRGPRGDKEIMTLRKTSLVLATLVAALAGASTFDSASANSNTGGGYYYGLFGWGVWVWDHVLSRSPAEPDPA